MPAAHAHAHAPPTPDGSPHLDSRDVPATDTQAIATARAIKSTAYDAGYLSGYEAGLRGAQTSIDAAAAELGRTEERARVEALIAHFEPISSGIDDRLLAAIRSGEPAPEAK